MFYQHDWVVPGSTIDTTGLLGWSPYDPAPSRPRYRGIAVNGRLIKARALVMDIMIAVLYGKVPGINGKLTHIGFCPADCILRKHQTPVMA